MEIFAKDVMPIAVVKRDKTDNESVHLKYHAGALKAHTLEGVQSVAQSDLIKWMEQLYGWDAETRTYAGVEKLTRNVRIQYYTLVNDKRDAIGRMVAVLAASADGQPKPFGQDSELEAPEVMSLYFNQPDFFEECYQAAIKLNVSLAVTEDDRAANGAGVKDEATAKKNSTDGGREAVG